MENHPQSSVSQSGLTCIEICSGAGGQAIGLERAGFETLAHVEFDRHACETHLLLIGTNVNSRLFVPTGGLKQRHSGQSQITGIAGDFPKPEGLRIIGILGSASGWHSASRRRAWAIHSGWRRRDFE